MFLLWRGPIDRHGTVQWKVRDERREEGDEPAQRKLEGYHRIGTSVQIPARLARACTPGGKLWTSEGEARTDRLNDLDARRGQI